MFGDSNRPVTHRVWSNPGTTLKVASAEMEHIILYVHLTTTVSNSIQSSGVDTVRPTPWRTSPVLTPRRENRSVEF